MRRPFAENDQRMPRGGAHGRLACGPQRSSSRREGPTRRPTRRPDEKARREGPKRRPDEKAHTRRHAGSSAGRFGKTVGRGRVRSRIQLVPAKSCSPSVPAKPWQKAKSEPCRVQPPATKPPETKPPRAQPLEPKPATERGSTSMRITSNPSGHRLSVRDAGAPDEFAETSDTYALRTCPPHSSLVRQWAPQN
jgi:hypothetical protein